MAPLAPVNAADAARNTVTGKTSVEEARQTYAKIAMAFKKGEKHPYTQALAFDHKKVAAGDPDQPLSPNVAAR